MSSRCQQFAFTFHPNGKDEDDGAYRTRTITANGAPVEVQNSMFSGRMLLLHDTGNEPEAKPAAPEGRRGLELRIQGKFCRASTTGDRNSTGLWICGEMGDNLKLGWIMKNVVDVCAKYARKKCEGRLHFNLGGKDKLTGKEEKPTMAFPLGQLFSVVGTPPGEEVLAIDSPEWDKVKWEMSFPEINTESTYTMIWKTPFLDVFSWELLKVPGVSPLPLESILGEIQTARVFLYDLGVAGSHKNCKSGPLIEWHFARGAGPVQDEPPIEVPSTPLDCASEASDEEAEAMEEAELQDDEGTVIEDGEANSESSGESDGDSDLDEENDEEQSIADSEALQEIAAWRPRGLGSEEEQGTVQIQTPYYIEAIDRRRRRKMCVWYVFSMVNPASTPTSPDRKWWLAKAATELAQLCRPRRRLRMFRRGPGARRYTCYAVKTLEAFRQVIALELESDTLLRSRVLTSAATATVIREVSGRSGGSKEGGAAASHHAQRVEEEEEEEQPAPTETRSSPRNSAAQTPASIQSAPSPPNSQPRLQLPSQISQSAVSASSRARSLASPARLARKVAQKRNRRIAPLPPRFFVAQGAPLCSIAFAHAKEGRKNVLREGLVGAIHFEGRLCEELLRLSTDGVVRCFTPYDCDSARVRLHLVEVKRLEKVEDLMLGRFYVWKVHTMLRVFEFCSSSEEERQEWMDCFDTERKQEGIATPVAGKSQGIHGSPHEFISQFSQMRRSIGGSTNMYISRGTTALVREPSDPKSPHVGKTHSSDGLLQREVLVPSDITAFLTDSTRARRWRPKRRLVLNDRVIVTPDVAPMPLGIVEDMLEKVLAFADQPSQSDLCDFQDLTCHLKAVRFDGCSQPEMLAFWLNTYHCLLLHGCALLGTPKSKAEQSRFYTRVSYLVGPYPFSLSEIERTMLRVPKPDPQLDLARDRARQRARQMLGFCGMGARSGRSSAPAASIVDSQDDDDDDDDDYMHQGAPTRQGQHDRNQKSILGRLNRSCMPMPTVKLPNFPGRQEATACLFLGQPPESVQAPKLDMKVILCLNRGNLTCPKSIPVFHASRLPSELDDIARQFTSEFVRVEEADGRAVRVTMPQSILGIKKEMQSDDPDALIQYMWQLMPEERRKVPLPQGVPVKFVRHNEAPRRWMEFKRAGFVDPELQIPLPRAHVPEAKRASEAQLADAAETIDVDAQNAGANKEQGSEQGHASAQSVRERGQLIQTIRL